MKSYVIAAAIGGYVAATFLTGGYYANHRCGESADCGIAAPIAGAFWPLYWAGRASLWVTR